MGLGTVEIAVVAAKAVMAGDGSGEVVEEWGRKSGAGRGGPEELERREALWVCLRPEGYGAVPC